MKTRLVLFLMLLCPLMAMLAGALWMCLLLPMSLAMALLLWLMLWLVLQFLVLERLVPGHGATRRVAEGQVPGGTAGHPAALERGLRLQGGWSWLGRMGL